MKEKIWALFSLFKIEWNNNVNSREKLLFVLLAMVAIIDGNEDGDNTKIINYLLLILSFRLIKY